MSVNINLADKRNPNQEKKEKIKKIKAVSVALLILTAFLAVIIFAMEYRFSASYVKKQKTQLMQSLEPYSETSSKLFIVNSKLAETAKLMDTRNDYHEKINIIIEDMDEAILVDEFTTREEEITVEMFSRTLSPFDDYLNSLMKLSEEGEIEKITLNSLMYDEIEAIYSLELILQL